MSTLLVVGTGLIGGSFALAARAAGLFEHFHGIDADPAALAAARARGIIDQPAPDVAPTAVCIATPVGGIAGCVAQMAQRHPNATLFDVGSVKAPAIRALREQGALPAAFVPCHPVAGSERHGAAAAKAGLFEGCSVIVTPVAETAPAAVARVSGWWRQVGATVTEQTPEAHDCLLAATSHLPHLLAFALMELLDDVDDATLRRAVGGGFRDFTRIAAADPAVWGDILHENRDAVLHWVEALTARLEIAEDKTALVRRLAAAQAKRRTLDG